MFVILTFDFFIIEIKRKKQTVENNGNAGAYIANIVLQLTVEQYLLYTHRLSPLFSTVYFFRKWKSRSLKWNRRSDFHLSENQKFSAGSRAMQGSIKSDNRDL